MRNKVEYMNNAPIGIFDSGLGGLTVARAVIDKLPDEEIVYLGDTEHTPYGPRAIAQVRSLTLSALDELASRGVKALVIACNTATAAALADAVGATGTVISIEGSPVTHKDARSNFAPDGCSRTENSADTRIEVIRGDVARHLVDLKTALEFGEIPAIDAVVLDPSREGANRTTLERLDALDPKRILYVACDPASLGRDTGILRELGWDMVQLRAFDMYPNTHHVESVALFERAPAKPRPRRRRTK